MKRAFLYLTAGIMALTAAVSCDKYDDTALKNSIKDLEGRVATLEDLVKTANSNVSSLTSIVESLQGSVYVTSMTPTANGYTLLFSNGTSVSITNGNDGTNGTSLSIRKDEDGVYYWTADGDWLLGDNGEKLPVCGTPGTDGTDGVDGIDGVDGVDGVTPQFKIEDGYWFLSVDDGQTWTKQGQATGDKGEDGDSMFKSFKFDDSYVYIVLADGQELKLSRGANGVMSIAVIPDYSDGSVDASKRSFDIRVDIMPKYAAESVSKLDLSCFTVKCVYTRTKAEAGEFFKLPISSVELKNGVLYVHVSSTFSAEFHAHKVGASASLIIDDGQNAFTTGYFPLYNGRE